MIAIAIDLKSELNLNLVSKYNKHGNNINSKKIKFIYYGISC